METLVNLWTPAAPAWLISVRLCGDFKLLHAMDLCLLVLTGRLDGSTEDL